VVDIEEHMARVIEQDFVEQAGDRRADELTVYTCPDCGGVMWQAEEAPPLKFRCHVGHAYAPEMLLGLKSEELESALWACVRLLREKSTLSRQMAARSPNGGNRSLAERIEEQAELDERHARVIRELLEAMPNPGDQAAVVVDAFERQAGD
jgi:two-component system chemotaxis response regulator CheB